MNSIKKKGVRANDEETHGQKYDETKKNVKDEIISVAGNLFYIFSFSQLFKEFLSFWTSLLCVKPYSHSMDGWTFHLRITPW